MKGEFHMSYEYKVTVELTWSRNTKDPKKIRQEIEKALKGLCGKLPKSAEICVHRRNTAKELCEFLEIPLLSIGAIYCARRLYRPSRWARLKVELCNELVDAGLD
jgi:hypothetical protein